MAPPVKRKLKKLIQCGDFIKNRMAYLFSCICDERGLIPTNWVFIEPNVCNRTNMHWIVGEKLFTVDLLTDEHLRVPLCCVDVSKVAWLEIKSTHN